MKLIVKLMMTLTLLFFVKNAFAFGMRMSEIEFSQLSRHCQLFYAGTDVGIRFGYSKLFPDDVVKKYYSIADRTGGAWHYCAGLVYMARADRTANKKEKQENNKLALDEINFTARLIKKDNPYYPEVILSQARALERLGNKLESEKNIKKLTTDFPNYVPAYIELAKQAKAKGKTSDAISILESVPNEMKAKSADLNYFLGVYYFQANQLEKSKEHAKLAYSLGYPLPGLRNMLRRKGIVI